MTGKGIGFLILGVSTVGGLVLNWLSDGEAKESALGQAVKKKIDQKYQDAVNSVKLRNDTIESEEKTLAQHMKDWALRTNRSVAIKAVNEQADKKITALENDKTLVENKRVADLEEKRKTALASSKKALGYERAKKAMEETIKKANEKYEKQVAMLDTSDESLTETATSIRHAAEKSKNQTIENAKKLFGEIEAKYQVKVSEWDERLLEAKTIREEMLAEGRKHILEEKEEQMAQLDLLQAAERKDALDNIVMRRTAEQKEALEKYPENLRYIKEQDSQATKEAKTAYEDLSRQEKLSMYLQKRNFNPAFFVMLTALPIVGVGLLVWEYVKFIAEIISGMKED